MNKKKPTKKEIETVISSMITHLRHLEEKISALDSLFGLYLDWKKEKDKFNKFIESEVQEAKSKFDSQQESESGDSK